MRHAVRIAASAFACSALLAVSACGSEPVGLAKGDPYHKGAEIFSQRCAGCHTLSVAGTQGSNTSAKDKEITDGPNFNQRKETEANVLYALRNGGFSNKIMPQNIVTGDEAREVARFLAKYAGAKAANPRGPKPASADAGSDAAVPGQAADGKPVGGSDSPAGNSSGETEGDSFTGETTPDGPVTIEPNGEEVISSETTP